MRHPLRKHEDGAAAANLIGLKPSSEQTDPASTASLSATSAGPAFPRPRPRMEI